MADKRKRQETRRAARRKKAARQAKSGDDGSAPANLRTVVEALLAAAPWAITARFPEGPGHCIPASMAGAEALDAFGVSAKPLRCHTLCFVDQNGKMDMTGGLATGRTPRERYDTIINSGIITNLAKAPPFDEWVKNNGETSPEAQSVHAVIEATLGSSLAMIDLTAGQMSGRRITLPQYLAWDVPPAEKWPRLGIANAGGPGRNGVVIYRPSTPESIPPWPDLDHHVIAADLVDLMKIALRERATFSARMVRERWPTLPPDSPNRLVSLWK